MTATKQTPIDSTSSTPENAPTGFGGVVLGAVFGIGLALWTFGLDFFRGDPTYWNYLWGDAGSGLAAFRYYLDEPWGFPLLEANTINSPNGVNLAFTDSLPILAILAKALRPLGISPEQWWSWWYLFIYAAQGASAAYAIRSWGAKSTVLQVSAALIALGGPIFLIRTWHPGLAGQFTLLLAWAFIGQLRQNRSPKRTLAFGVLITIVSLLVHVYLLLGVVVIIVGGVINETVQGNLEWPTAAKWFASLTAAIATVGVVGGYFTAGAAKADGYFLVGMHLLGPVVPQRSTLWPGNEWTINASGSFDAINWVGFGWIGLAVAGLVACRHSLGDAARRYQVLIAALITLTLYSITPVIRIRDDNPHDLRTPLRWVWTDFDAHRYIYGTAALAAVLAGSWMLRKRPEWPLRNGLIAFMASATIWAISMLTDPFIIDTITGQFRAAGRLFWGISYGVLVVSAVALDRSKAKLGTAVFAALAVSLATTQIIDTAAFRGLAGETLDPTPERVERLDDIANLIAGYDHIHVEPSYNCAAALAGYDGIWAYQDIGIVASWDRQDIDAAYAARKPDEDCSITPVLNPDPTYVNVIVAASNFIETVPPEFACESVGLIVACSTTDANQN